MSHSHPSNTIVYPADSTEEKALYSQLYESLYKRMGSTGLDYENIAEKTSLSKRKIRECLVYRLGAGEVRQLFNHQQGVCYLCQGQLFHPQSTEPLCLTCLQRIEHTVNPPAGPTKPTTGMPLSRSFGTETPVTNRFEATMSASSPVSEAPRITETSTPETVSPEAYRAALAELAYYKTLLETLAQKYPELANLSPPENFQADTALDRTSDNASGNLLSKLSNEDQTPGLVSRDSDGCSQTTQPTDSLYQLMNPAHDILAILNDDDDATQQALADSLEGTEEELQIAGQLGRDALRHFGFKRVKKSP